MHAPPRPGDPAGEPVAAHAGGAGDLPDFVEAVLDLVDQVPAGKVVTYGDVAEMVGGSGPRRVGNVLSRYGGLTSWWRVLRAGGDPPVGKEDVALGHYRDEGTPLVGDRLTGRRVDLVRARWSGPAAGDGPVGRTGPVGGP